MERKSLGMSGEDEAAHFITTLGWKILGRNIHYHFGEIDILADSGESIVIIEVKAKTSISHGYAVEMITPTKQRVLRRLAKMVEQAYNKPVRIDVIAIDNYAEGTQALTHYPYA